MTDARSDIWMPMTWGDYARATGHLNATMHGAYLMLTKHYWCAGAPLPDDDVVLWRVACCDSIAQWKKIRPVIAAFFQVGEGLWRHKRIERELAEAKKRVSNAHARGKAGATARWKDQACLEDASSIDQASPKQCSSNGKSQSQSHSSEPNGSGVPPTAREIIFHEYLPWVMEKLGKDREHCATQMGTLVKDAGGDYDIALTALRAARQADVANPFTYAKGCMKPRESYEQKRQRENLAIIEAYDERH